MTMKIAITNLGNRTGDVLVKSGTGIPRRIRRGETEYIDEQGTVSFTLRQEHAGGDDELVGTPNLIVCDPPRTE